MKNLAVITGATGGIGSVIAQTLVDSDVSVVLTGRDRSSLVDLQHRLLANSPSNSEIYTEEVDINDGESVQGVAEHVIKVYGVPTMLIHAAGDHPARPLADTTDGDWVDSVNGKLLGAVRLIRSFSPHMRSANKGSIVLIGGLFRAEPSPLFPIGSVLNAGLGALMKSVSKDFAVDNVRINIVDPGPVSTKRWGETCHELTKYIDDDPHGIDTNTRASIPMGRLASPEDVANAVSFLVSNKSEYITGTSLIVDGGMAGGIV